MKGLFVLLFVMAICTGLSAQAHASVTITATAALNNGPRYDSVRAVVIYNYKSSYRHDVFADTQGDHEGTGSSLRDGEEGPNNAADFMYNPPSSTSRYHHDNGYYGEDGAEMRGDHDWIGFYRRDHDGNNPGDHCGRLPSIPIPGALGLFGTGLAGLAAKKMLAKQRHGKV